MLLALENDELAQGQLADAERLGSSLQLKRDPPCGHVVGPHRQSRGQGDGDRVGRLHAAYGNLDDSPAAQVALHGLLQPFGQQLHVGHGDVGAEDRPEGSVDQFDPRGLGVREGIDRGGQRSEVGGNGRGDIAAGKKIEEPRGGSHDGRGRVVSLGKGLLGVQGDAQLGCGYGDDLILELQFDVQFDDGLGHLLNDRFERRDCLLGLEAADVHARHDGSLADLGLLARLVHLPRDDQSADDQPHPD